MNQSSETPANDDATSIIASETAPSEPIDSEPEMPQATAESINAPVRSQPPPSFIKLAMRNMVRQGGTSLFHFALTAIGLLGLLVGLAYLTR